MLKQDIENRIKDCVSQQDELREYYNKFVVVLHSTTHPEVTYPKIYKDCSDCAAKYDSLNREIDCLKQEIANISIND